MDSTLYKGRKYFFIIFILKTVLKRPLLFYSILLVYDSGGLFLLLALMPDYSGELICIILISCIPCHGCIYIDGVCPEDEGRNGFHFHLSNIVFQ